MKGAHNYMYLGLIYEFLISIINAEQGIDAEKIQIPNL